MPQTQTADADREERSRWELLLLALIIAVGAYLRFHMLGVRSLWPAECFSVLVARQPWPQFLHTMWWGEGNMAFYYTLLRGWLVFGDSEAWLQSLSAVFGVLTIPAVYALGRRFLGRGAGLIAAALIAVHSFHIEHSEQLRSYSLVTLLVVFSTFAFLDLVSTPKEKRWWLLYVVFSALAIYAQTFTIFLLCAQWLAIGPEGIRRVGILKIFAATSAVAFLASPVLTVMLLENKGQLDWVPPPSTRGMLNVVWGIVGADTLSPETFAGSLVLLVLYVVAIVWAIWGLYGFEKADDGDSVRRTATTVLVWCLVFPVVAMAAVSFVKPILYPRYVLMCVPAAVLLAAEGIASVNARIPHARLLAWGAFVAMVVLALMGTHRFDTGLRNFGLDWRGAANYILAHRQPGDAVIFYNFGGGWTWDYYVARAREAGDHDATPPALFPLKFDSASIVQRTAPYRRVWIVLHQDLSTPQSEANDAVLTETLSQHFHLAEERELTGDNMIPGEDVNIHLALYTAEGLPR